MEPQTAAVAVYVGQPGTSGPLQTVIASLRFRITALNLHGNSSSAAATLSGWVREKREKCKKRREAKNDTERDHRGRHKDGGCEGIKETERGLKSFTISYSFTPAAIGLLRKRERERGTGRSGEVGRRWRK